MIRIRLSAFTFAAILCLTSDRQAHAQATGPFASAHPPVLTAHAHGAIVRRLGEAARLQGIRLAASRAVSQTQSASGAANYRAVKWGALIGAIAGGAGGALQPTHSNGEYVLGHNRFTSALALGGIGAGVGALAGLAIEKSR
jgi:hypothetical protein